MGSHVPRDTDCRATVKVVSGQLRRTRPMSQTPRNSGERRRASATTRAAPRLTTGTPMPRTRKTVAPGLLVIRTTAALNGERRAMTPSRPSAATWNSVPSLRLSTVATSACVTPLRGTRTFAKGSSRDTNHETFVGHVRARSLRYRAAVASSLSEAA